MGKWDRQEDVINEAILECMIKGGSVGSMERILESIRYFTKTITMLSLKDAGMTEERAKEILDVINSGEYLIRVKLINADAKILPNGAKSYGFKIRDKYVPIHESRKAGSKYIQIL
ncbi:4627_t:CDS:1 [Paraglomus brasilianum]|uniref:4627_t:CDS:1 n=1 Tax=Paraglomus brasilianum TaxID=144538 RepID=A0A9N9BP92_9GLOM|nr:4627_t:CDS:1 [Paraglomus brasilianum]